MMSGDREITRDLDALIEAKVNERINALVQSRLEELITQGVAKAMQHQETKGGKKRLAIVASKGTLDMAYPPLILATTAAALGWEVGIFFTFYGLDIINRRKLASLKVPPLGNPAMPVPVPNLMGAIPGMTLMATAMMKNWFRRAQIPTVRELLDEATDSGVQLIGCTTTMGVMGVSQSDLIPQASLAGAAAFLDFASEANATIFV